MTVQKTQKIRIKYQTDACGFVNNPLLQRLCRWLFSPLKHSLSTEVTVSVWVCASAWQLVCCSLCTAGALSPRSVFRICASGVDNKAPWFPPALLFNCCTEMPPPSGMSRSLLEHPRWGAEDCRGKSKASAWVDLSPRPEPWWLNNVRYPLTEALLMRPGSRKYENNFVW